MTNKKSPFFTLIFSLCPGAGEMYMGLYKQGISLMVLFFGSAAIGMWLNMEEIMILMWPIVWCYSFFHTHNLRRMPEEEFAALEDRFLFEEHIGKDFVWEFNEKHRRIFGVILLLMGITVLWRAALSIFGAFFQMPDFLWVLNTSLPQIVMAGIVLYAAIHLLREPKETEDAEDLEEMEQRVAEELQADSMETTE